MPLTVILELTERALTTSPRSCCRPWRGSGRSAGAWPWTTSVLTRPPWRCCPSSSPDVVKLDLALVQQRPTSQIAGRRQRGER
jgi:hypothetical protein